MSHDAGMIVIWSGPIGTIPAGWHLCDGTFGTPDLRDRFIPGAGDDFNPGDMGGALAHNHPFTGDGHTHLAQAGSPIQSGSGRDDTMTTTPVTGTTDATVHLPPLLRPRLHYEALMVSFHIRLARLDDLQQVYRFVDYWLTGTGMKDHAPGAVHDCFITPSQHQKYILKYTTTLLFHQRTLIGWAVVQQNGSLIHFLISGHYRGQGHGSRLLTHIHPQRIRSKSDQSSGDPAPFYEKLGYIHVDTVQSRRCTNIDQLKPNRPKNIKIFERV